MKEKLKLYGKYAALIGGSVFVGYIIGHTSNTVEGLWSLDDGTLLVDQRNGRKTILELNTDKLELANTK